MSSAAASLVRQLAWAADPGRLRRRAGDLLATTAVYVAAGLMALMAAIFALMAAHAGLREVMPAWAAALTLAGVFLALALVAWAIARRGPRAILRRPIPASPAPTEIGAAAAVVAALAPLLGEAIRATRERPGETMLTMLAAGLIAGAWRPGPRR